MPPGDEKAGDGTKGSSKDGRDHKDGGGSNKKHFSPQKAATGPQLTKFEGRCKELKGHIYNCSDARQSDLFTKTTKEIALYVGRTYTYGGDMKIAVESLAMPTLKVPTDPPATATKTEELIWKKKVEEYVRRESYLEENIKSLFSLVWGQCTDIMRQKVEVLDAFDKLAASNDGIALLKTIKNTAFSFETQKNSWQASHEAIRHFYMVSQGKHMTMQDYLKHFQNMVDVIDHTGGVVGKLPGLEDKLLLIKGKTLAQMMIEEKATLPLKSQERYLAMAFMLSADRSRYGRLLEEMENEYLKGTDNWPTTVTGAYHLLTNYHQDPRNMMRMGAADGVAFANAGTETAVTLAQGGVKKKAPAGDRSKITCFNCGGQGHMANDCPEKETNKDGAAKKDATYALITKGIAEGEFEEGDVNFLDGVQFMQQHVVGTAMHTKSEGGRVPGSWILLDNQSTVNVFHNAKLLTNVRKRDKTLDIHCNAGIATTNLIGDFPGYGMVWYHPKGIANILSLSRMRKHGYRVMYYSGAGNQFIVHMSDGSAPRIFQQSECRLFYMDMRDQNGKAVALVNTVASNKTKYTERAYSRAVLARRLQRIIGRPSTRTFLRIVDDNLLPNCPITRKDILAAEHIFGPDVGSLKGKTVRRGAPHVDICTVDIPASLISQYREVVLAADVMFVNNIPFFVTILRDIKFGTTKVLSNQKTPALKKALTQVLSIYKQRSFIVTTVLMVGQFEPLCGDLADLHLTLNTVSNDEHVPEVERHIRTVKEHTRCVYTTLPFRRLPV
jgi:hypothetical protein